MLLVEHINYQLQILVMLTLRQHIERYYPMMLRV